MIQQRSALRCEAGVNTAARRLYLYGARLRLQSEREVSQSPVYVGGTGSPKLDSSCHLLRTEPGLRVRCCIALAPRGTEHMVGTLTKPQ